jgi:lipocalin-like protein
MTKQRLDGRGIQEQLLGTWKMLAWRRQVVATGEVSDALGPEPRGFITYTADARVTVLVVKRDRPMPSNLTPTPAEKIALYDSLFAYSGTYSVDAEQVTHHIDTSWNEAWNGTHQVRYCTIEGNRLTYRSPPAKDPMDGQECRYTVEFEKVPEARS